MEGLESDVWRGRRVLLTGHTGFKGSWLALCLQHVHAEVTGVSLRPVSPSLYEQARIGEVMAAEAFVDLRDRAGLREVVRRVRPEIVLHLAGQSLVHVGRSDPLRTFETNLMGTLHLLDALRDVESARVAVIATSDKVYARGPLPHDEGAALGGREPYAASKACVELAVDAYRPLLPQLRIATVRAGNVIGGGDWGERRLVPDAVRAWSSGTTLEVRAPEAVRPWQHVTETARFYLQVARLLWTSRAAAGAWNVPPGATEPHDVAAVISILARAWGPDARWRPAVHAPPRDEDEPLVIDGAKAVRHAAWSRLVPFEEGISWTAQWYRRRASGVCARRLCSDQIAEVARRTAPQLGGAGAAVSSSSRGP